MDPRRKAELSIPVIAYPEMLWKKQYRVCMLFMIFAVLTFRPVPEMPDSFQAERRRIIRTTKLRNEKLRIVYPVMHCCGGIGQPESVSFGLPVLSSSIASLSCPELEHLSLFTLTRSRCLSLPKRTYLG